MRRDKVPGVAIPTVDISESCVADPYGILQYPGKHGLKITGRVRYDLKHLRGRGLLLQRFGEVGGSLAQLVRQCADLFLQLCDGALLAARSARQIKALGLRSLLTPRFRWLTASCAMPPYLSPPWADDSAYHIGRTVVQHSNSAKAGVEKGHFRPRRRTLPRGPLPLRPESDCRRRKGKM